MTKNYAELYDNIQTKLSAALDSLSPSERTALAGMVRDTLDVPGVLWSPEDFRDLVSAHEDDEDKINEIADNAWATFDPMITEQNWIELQYHLDYMEGN